MHYKRISLTDEHGVVKKISFRIPKKIKDRGKIRLKGQGEPGINGGANGDIILNVKINNEKDVWLEEDNIVSRLKITPWEALLGGEISVDLFDGRHTVRIPKGIQTGKRIRFKGKGLGSSDLYLEAAIVNPTSPTREEIELYEKLKEKSKYIPGR